MASDTARLAAVVDKLHDCDRILYCIAQQQLQLANRAQEVFNVQNATFGESASRNLELVQRKLQLDARHLELQANQTNTRRDALSREADALSERINSAIEYSLGRIK